MVRLKDRDVFEALRQVINDNMRRSFLSEAKSKNSDDPLFHEPKKAQKTQLRDL